MKEKKLLGMVQQKQKVLSNMSCVLMYKHCHKRHCLLGSAHKTVTAALVFRGQLHDRIHSLSLHHCCAGQPGLCCTEIERKFHFELGRDCSTLLRNCLGKQKGKSIALELCAMVLGVYSHQGSP